MIRSLILIFVLMITFQASAQSNPVKELLESYKNEGVKSFSLENGKAMWSKTFITKGEERSCVTCHTEDLSKPGKRADTGKVIKPMLASVYPKRYTDKKFIKKWLKRNCKWTYGRFCTPQEKGDFLVYLTSE